MNIKKLSRRNFFKASAIALGSIVTIQKGNGLLSTALAANPDDSITKQNYIHDVAGGKFKDDKDKAKFDKHQGKIDKHLKKIKKTGDIKPMCKYCTHYKKPEGGYGECAMVGAKGDKKVHEKGWCKVWAINKKEVEAAAS